MSDDNLKFYLNNELLNVVTTVKYLGCILSKNLNDFLDIERCSTAFNKVQDFYLGNFIILTYIYFFTFLIPNVHLFTVVNCGLRKINAV